MNIIIVGAGGHALSWKAYINAHEGWKLVGIVDTDTEKLQHANMWGVPDENAYPSIDDAVHWGDDKIDAALITTPIPTHHLLATEAIEHGLHVIVEKNMATTIEQARAMVMLARQHPELCTMVGTQYRFRPLWWTVHQLLHVDDAIGKLSVVRARSTAYSGDMRSGWRAWLEDIYTHDMMIHHMDVLRYTTGLEFIMIQARVFKPAWSKWLGASSAMMNFVMAPRGKEEDKDEWVHGQYYGDWQSKGLKADWEDNFEFYGPRGSIRIEPPETRPLSTWEKGPLMTLAGEGTGTHITLYQDTKEGKHIITPIEKRQDVEQHPQGFIDQMYMLDDFYQSIQSGGQRQPMINFEEAYKSFLATRLAVLSSQTEKTIWVPDYWLEPVPNPG